jgi:Flp pilus assembly protein TadG
MTLQIRKTSRRLLHGERGMAAVEFALIAPVLVAMVLTLVDVGDMAVGVMNMQTAVRAGTQYFLNGGNDTAVAESEVSNLWSSRPSGATQSATKACTCAGTAQDCFLNCSDGTPPQISYTITATATLGGSVVSSSKTITETVRTQ